MVHDLTALASLVQLQTLVLGFNEVTDIAPLAALGDLHSVGLEGNPLDEPARTINMPALQARGEDVTY